VHLLGLHLLGVHLMGVYLVGRCHLGVYLRGMQLSGRNCCPAEIAAEVAALILPGIQCPRANPHQSYVGTLIARSTTEQV
jgi:hypothetical protein